MILTFEGARWTKSGSDVGIGAALFGLLAVLGISRHGAAGLVAAAHAPAREASRARSAAPSGNYVTSSSLPPMI